MSIFLTFQNIEMKVVFCLFWAQIYEQYFRHLKDVSGRFYDVFKLFYYVLGPYCNTYFTISTENPRIRIRNLSHSLNSCPTWPTSWHQWQCSHFLESYRVILKTQMGLFSKEKSYYNLIIFMKLSFM
jgi:hypothetical protein